MSPANSTSPGSSAHTKREWVLLALDEFESRLTRYALRLTNDEHAARDAVQHTFLRLCDETPEKLSGRLAPWLFAVCRNKALDAVRRRTNESVSGDVETGTDECLGREPDPADFAESQELYLRLRAIVQELPVHQREVIDLWADGFRYREIAEITSLSEGNARVLLHRSFNALREHPAIRAWFDETKETSFTTDSFSKTI